MAPCFTLKFQRCRIELSKRETISLPENFVSRRRECFPVWVAGKGGRREGGQCTVLCHLRQDFQRLGLPFRAEPSVFGSPHALIGSQIPERDEVRI